ncbi:MAG: hypothetical protein ACOC80_14190 [Petrotogales bacterium]
MKFIPSVSTLKPLLFSAAGAVAADFAITKLEEWAADNSDEGFGKFLTENSWSPYAVVAVGGMLLLNYQKELGSGIFIVSLAQLATQLINKE